MSETLLPTLRPRTSGRHYMMKLLQACFTSYAHQAINGRDQLVIVDYGCGNMPYRALFNQPQTQYIGADLDVNPDAHIHLRPDGTLPMESASADIVLSTQVLEHVLDPALYLAESYRVLKPGGYLILSTHGYWIFHPHPTDLWRWTSQGLRLIVEQAGFHIRDFSGLMGLSATGLHLFQDGVSGSRRFPKPFKPAFHWVMQSLIQLIDRSHHQQNARDAAVYMLIAQKSGGA